MKYIKSTTQKAYIFDGRVVPKCVTKDNSYLSLSNDDYIKLCTNKVFSSLVKAGSLIVLDKAPQTAEQRNNVLTNKVAQMAMENTRLKEELLLVKGQLNSGASTEIEALQAKLEQQIASDTAEIQALQAEKDAEIASLKAQLEAATSASKAAATAAAKVAETEGE